MESELFKTPAGGEVIKFKTKTRLDVLIISLRKAGNWLKANFGPNPDSALRLNPNLRTPSVYSGQISLIHSERYTPWELAQKINMHNEAGLFIRIIERGRSRFFRHSPSSPA